MGALSGIRIVDLTSVLMGPSRHVESRFWCLSRGFWKEFSHEVNLVGNADLAGFKLSLADSAERFDARESRLGTDQGLEAPHRTKSLP